MDNGYFFLEMIEILKNTTRRGWELHNVPNPESVSDHMYRMAIMCLMIPTLDERTRTRAICMALIHDIGEAIIGDITPSDGVSQEDKYIREEMAVKFLACTLRPSNPAMADTMIDLWYEYEKGETQAARLVKQVDKLECIHQAVVYETQNDVALDEFMTLKDKVTLPELKPLLETCLDRRGEIVMRKKSDIVVIFVIGGPGVGKGTQCKLLAQEFGFHHVSVGDLLREEAARPLSPYRDFIPESIKKSVLLPAQLTTQLLSQEMSRAQVQGKFKFLLDGFPRNIAQAVDFESKICNHYATLSLDCSEAEFRQRLQQRSTLSDRIDDNPESIVRRLQTFNENNATVLEHLRKRGPVLHVECSGSVDEVYVYTREKVEEILVKTESQI